MHDPGREPIEPAAFAGVRLFGTTVLDPISGFSGGGEFPASG